MGVYFSIAAILSIGLIFYLARSIGLEFPFLMYNDLTQGFYLASGVRVLAVLLFGWLGIAGIVCGWLLCHWLGGERTLLECLLIGILSGTSAYAAMRLWQWGFLLDNRLESLTAGKLLALVVVNGLISAIVRFAYVRMSEGETPFLWVFSLGFLGDILGGLAVLYLFKLVRSFSRVQRI